MNFEDIIGLLILLVYGGSFLRRARKQKDAPPNDASEPPKAAKSPSLAMRLMGKLLPGLLEAAARAKRMTTAAPTEGTAVAPDKGKAPEEEAGRLEKTPDSLWELFLDEREEKPAGDAAEAPVFPEEGLPEDFSLDSGIDSGDGRFPEVSDRAAPAETATRDPLYRAEEESDPTMRMRRKKPGLKASTLRNAVVWAELLGPPRALKPRRPVGRLPEKG